VQLTKHHGLANDFLVVLDEVNGAGLTIDGELARQVCDRRRGVGADGLIHGERPPAGGDVDVVMHLFNADGSRAEMSGNGIRCLGQAVAMAREVRELVLHVATDAGVRRVQVELSADEQTGTAAVDMGPAHEGPPIPEAVSSRLTRLVGDAGEVRAVTVDLGNPHLVAVVPDPTDIDLTQEGPPIETAFAEGINVEFISAPDPDALVLRVWERGAGVTQACGTGACAAVYAAHSWGLVSDWARVEMTGGTAEVFLGPSITLVGPTTHIATLELPDA
jgi:diaminopimelate epimerase